MKLFSLTYKIHKLKNGWFFIQRYFSIFSLDIPLVGKKYITGERVFGEYTSSASKKKKTYHSKETALKYLEGYINSREKQRKDKRLKRESKQIEESYTIRIDYVKK